MIRFLVLSLTLSVVFLFTPFVVKADEQNMEYISICKFDLNRDGVVNATDFNILRSKMKYWSEVKCDKVMKEFRESYGKTCERTTLQTIE